MIAENNIFTNDWSGIESIPAIHYYSLLTKMHTNSSNCHKRTPTQETNMPISSTWKLNPISNVQASINR